MCVFIPVRMTRAPWRVCERAYAPMHLGECMLIGGEHVSDATRLVAADVVDERGTVGLSVCLSVV